MPEPTIHMMVQYSPEWWQARRGYPSASAFDRILTPGGKPSGQQDGYIAELIGDLVDLSPNFFTDRPMNRAMEHGRNTEPEARDYYTLERDGAAVRQVGGVVSACGRFWCSPDGLVGPDVTLELKCPQLKTQAAYLMDADVMLAAGTPPSEYRPQVHGHLIVTGRPYVDFLSYSPPLPPLLIRVERSEYTDKLAAELERFNEKYEAARKKLGVTRKPGDAE